MSLLSRLLRAFVSYSVDPVFSPWAFIWGRRGSQSSFLLIGKQAEGTTGLIRRTKVSKTLGTRGLFIPSKT